MGHDTRPIVHLRIALDGIQTYLGRQDMQQLFMKSIEKRALKCKALGYPRIKVYWVYIKKYSRDSRVNIPIHTDNTAVTGNVMLNEEGVDFLGG